MGYRLDTETGEWCHWKNMTFVDRKWLGDFNFYGEKKVVEDSFEVVENFDVILENAKEVINSAAKNAPKLEQQITYGDAEKLRWWLHPVEALQCLKNNLKIS